MDPVKLDASHLTPASLAQAAIGVGKGKANMPVLRMCVLAILAGMFIGCGALFMLYVKSDSTLSFAPSQVLGGLVFSLGLICVVVSGSELFTGNCLMIIGANDKAYSWGKTIKNWVIVWLFNFVGSLLLVFIVYFANCAGNNSGEVGNAMITVASSKINLDWTVIFFRGIGCNFLVCLAVWMGFAGKSVIDKIFTCIFPVMAFVALGFEHCVANMFFLPMGAILYNSGFEYTGSATTEALSNLTAGGVFFNLSASTLGNIVGGAIFVGFMYWLAFHKNNTADDKAAAKQ